MVAVLVAVLEIVRVIAIRDALECAAEGVKEDVTINVLDSVVTSVAERVPVSVSRRALVLVRHNVEMDARLHVRPLAIKDVVEPVQEIVRVHADLVAKGNVCITVLMFVENHVKTHVMSYALNPVFSFSGLLIVPFMVSRASFIRNTGRISECCSSTKEKH